MITLLFLVGIIAFLFIYATVLYMLITKTKMRVQETWDDLVVRLENRNDLLFDLSSSASIIPTSNDHFLLMIKKLTEIITQFDQLELKNHNAMKVFEFNKEVGRIILELQNYIIADPALSSHVTLKNLLNQNRLIEEKIILAVRHFNREVQAYNGMLTAFPHKLLTYLFNFKPYKYFKTT